MKREEGIETVQLPEVDALEMTEMHARLEDAPVPGIRPCMVQQKQSPRSRRSQTSRECVPHWQTALLACTKPLGTSRGQPTSFLISRRPVSVPIAS